eukprot:g14710.t1
MKTLAWLLLCNVRLAQVENTVFSLFPTRAHLPLIYIKNTSLAAAVQCEMSTTGFTFEGLENCLPEKWHAALLTVRRAGDAGGALYWSKPDEEKPDYEGERERARKNTSKRPECANKPTHTGSECKVRGPTYNGNKLNKAGLNRGQQRRNGATVRPSGGSIRNRGYANKPVANVAKETKTATIDEIEDAWVGMSIDPEADLSDLPPLVPIKSKQYNVEVNAVYPNCDIYNYCPVQRLAGTKHPVAAAAAQQAAPKKAKTAPEVKPLKCAHMAINGACAFYDCPLEMMVDDVDDVGGKGVRSTTARRKRHATIMEMEYWSLRLGFNLLPADWQNVVGLCRYCPSFQPPGGPAGTRYQLPARYDSRDLRNVYRRLHGFTDYGIVSPPTILAPYTRTSGDEPEFQPSRSKITRLHVFKANPHVDEGFGGKCQFGFKHFTPSREEELYLPFVQKAVAFFMVQANATVKQIRCDGDGNGGVGDSTRLTDTYWQLQRRLYRVYLPHKQKVEEHRNVRFNHSVRGYTASVNPEMWDEDAEKGNQLEQTDCLTPSKN